MVEDNNLKMRILYLEKELDNMREYIRQLEEKLEENPFTRDSFRDGYGNYRKFSN